MKLRAGFLNAQQFVTDLCLGEVGHNPETHTLIKIHFNIRYILPHRCLGLPRYFHLNFSNQMFGQCRR